MEERTHQGRGRALGGGVVAGVIGGAVIAIVMLVAAVAKQQDIWVGMKGAATPFIGERATVPGFDLGAVALGLLSHFAVSIVWGVLFAAIFYGLSRSATVVAGAVWGLVVWLGMYYVVLPVLGLSRMVEETPIGMAILSHVIFGLAVGIGFLPFQRTRPHAVQPVRRVPIRH